MPRPRDADPAKTFETIRAAALAELAENGIAALSVRRVAERAGVAMGTLRYYFARRDDLVEACLDHYHDRLMALEARMIAELADAPTPQAAADRAARLAFRLVATEPELHRLRVLTSLGAGGLPEHRRRTVRRPFLEQTAGALAAVSPVHVARLRLVVDSVMRLVAWYAACSDDELMDVTGAPDAASARCAIEDHIAFIAGTLPFGPDPSPLR